MIIQWYGQACFKLQAKDLTIITDPYRKDCGLTPPRFQTNITLLSDSRLLDASAVKSESFIIDGPGEYERMGAMIKGITSYQDDQEGVKKGLNTIYIIEIENVKICHLGNLGHALSDKQIERIDGVDILLAPVGEKALAIKEVVDIVSEIDPRIIVPMSYRIPQLKEKLTPVDKFLAEMGTKKEKPLSKLVVKKKNLPAEETQIVLLDHSRAWVFFKIYRISPALLE